MVLQFVGRAATVHNPTFEYLNRNVSIGQLLQHVSKSIAVCAQSRPKMLTKTYNKEVCRAFINYALRIAVMFPFIQRIILCLF